MSRTNVLNVLYGDIANSGYLRTTLTASDYSALRRWGDKVSLNPTVDPAKEFLQAVIFADAPAILAALVDPDSSTTKSIFPVIAHGGGFRGMMTPGEYADFIDNANFVRRTCYDGVQRWTNDSTALSLLARYLRGDTGCIKNLLYALTSRIWRIAPKSVRNYIYRETFLFHAYYFYTDLHTTTAELHMATPDDWDNFRFQQYAGHPAFGVLPWVDLEEVNDWLPSNTANTRFGYNEELTLVDFGEGGVAMATWVGDNEVYHFLDWDHVYEAAIQEIFDAVATDDDVVHSPVVTGEKPALAGLEEETKEDLESELELQQDWAEFHSI